MNTSSRAFPFTRAALVGLVLLTGCAAAPGMPGAFVLVLLLLFFFACGQLKDTDRMDEWLLRNWFFSSSSSSGKNCPISLDYTQSFDLSAVDPATAGIGFKITGHNAGDNFGTSISSAGDFNGDGVNDIVISAPAYNSNRGRVYVIFGQSDSGTDIDVSTLTTSQGITIDGAAGTGRLGRYDTGANGGGDLNGDGFDDIVMGERGADASWVVFGSASPTNVDLTSTSVAESARFRDAGGNFYYTGSAVTVAGDINSDGISDFIISNTYTASGDRGRPYVIYGKTSGWSASTNFASLTTGDGFTITGQGGNAFLSRDGVQGIGDVNGDGVGDMLFTQAGTGGYSTGGAFVIYGVSGNSRGNLDASSLAASDGYKLTGTNSGDLWGTSLAGAGGATSDFNGDGQPDFAIGSAVYNSSNGRVAVFLADTGALTIGSHSSAQGFTLDGASAEESSNQLAMNGDVNGDGKSDLLVGAKGADNSASDSGSVYLIFGQDGIASTGATLAGYADGTQGIRLDGPAASAGLGYDVALADVNGDSCADLLLGAVNSSGADYAYVIYGGD